MIEDQERYADPVDAGRCRNCLEKLDDGRNYCDEDCRNDHQMRIASDKRNGRKPIINEYGCENG